MPRLLELFSGTGSVGAAFQARGWDVVSVDLDPAGGPTIVADIDIWEGWRDYPVGYFDCVHASPPCTQYSRARTTALVPRDLVGADALVRRTLEIVFALQPTCWLIENPYTGMMKDRPVMQWLLPTMKVVSYCKYGSPFKKATAIWSNLALWQPRRCCSKLFPCDVMVDGRHPATAQRAPGKAPGGGRRSNDSFALNELYRIPAALCDELAEAATRQVLARPGS